MKLNTSLLLFLCSAQRRFTQPNAMSLVTLRAPLTYIGALCLSVLCGALGGCGGTVQPKASPAPVKASSNADPLSALLQHAHSAQQDAEETGVKASATLSIFIPTLFSDPKTQSIAQAHLLSVERSLKKSGVSREIRSKITSRFTIAPLTVKELPIHLETIIGAAGAQADEVRSAQGVLVIRYDGAPLKKSAHLKALCASTLKVLSAHIERGVVANLSTFEVMDAPALQARCRDLGQAWTRPAAELIKGDKVRLISRGLAQFGRPDLESTPISKSKAPQLFQRFQKNMQLLRSGPYVKVGDRLDGRKLHPCVRPEHTYDVECVRVTY